MSLWQRWKGSAELCFTSSLATGTQVALSQPLEYVLPRFSFSEKRNEPPATSERALRASARDREFQQK